MKVLLQKINGIISRIGFVVFLIGHFLWFVVRYTILGKLALAGLPLLLFTYLVFWESTGDVADNNEAKSTLLIPSGASFHQVADSLIKKDLLSNKTLFLILGRITGKEKKVRAGLFDIPRNLSPWRLLNYLENAPPHRSKVTLQEGILSDKMASLLQTAVGIDSARFVALVNDSAFANKLVPGAHSLEGYMLPETYFFEWKTSEEKIITHLVQEMLDIFDSDSVRKQLELISRDPYQILTLASIVEGEALVDSERVVIASLYYNRLRLGWPLQADPTIQYILPGPPRRLLHKHLAIDSPYNTYKYAGLPPGPINNPGKLSVLACIFPVASPYLYMVAIGDGRHKFSRTLREHNRWHAKFNEIRRQHRRNARKKSASGK